MGKWSKDKALEWYEENNWIVGCNYLPSNAINQLEMFQVETFDIEINKKELLWAKNLGFNSVRVYLHDLLWNHSKIFSKTLNEFLDICNDLDIKPILVLFDDCHRPFPKVGKQPKPVRGVHNSGWKQSPGMSLVHEINENIEHFIDGYLSNYGFSGVGDKYA